jgi:hypothetical protein
LNSTRPERGTSLILYRGAVVMPRCSSKAWSLPARIGDSAPKDSTSLASRYIFSSSVSLGGGCSSLALSYMLWSSGCCSSADVSWAVGLSGTTSSISKGSSSGDASCGRSGWDSWGYGTFRGASWPTGRRPVLLRVGKACEGSYRKLVKMWMMNKTTWPRTIMMWRTTSIPKKTSRV